MLFVSHSSYFSKGFNIFHSIHFCRVCQEKTEEPLVDLGCQCRGDLAKAHRTCIDVWFHTRGSNKCEICQ
jgi:E3 ubiquitin-protein ligase DOA10